MRIKELVVIAVLLWPMPSLTLASPLGIAGTYNEFILGDIDLKRTDSFGGVAAGGDAYLENFSVGSHLKTSLPLGDLVVGGNLDFASGSVGPTNVQNGTIVYGSSATLSSVGYDASRSGQGKPIDFAAEARYLTNLSSLWSRLDSNGVTEVYRNDLDDAAYRINLIGSSDTLNVFDLGELNMNGTIDLNHLGFFMDVPATSTILINVPGKTAVLDSFGFYFWDDSWDSSSSNNDLNDASLYIKGSLDGDGLFPDSRILYNFYEADSLTMSFLEIHGSILAPWADVLFSEGHIEGNLIAKSLAGFEGAFFDANPEVNAIRPYNGGEAHDEYFDGDLPVVPVPEPGTVLLVGVGLLLPALLKRRRWRASSA
jgi:choice-of-anchor A domain-containing protein